MADSFNDSKNLRLMLSLGIITNETDMSDVFSLWGRLIADPDIRARRRALPSSFPQYPAILGSFEDAIAGMNPKELIELRDRVVGVVKFPARQS